MTLFVNIFGGPGAGKSTTAAGVFHHLKAQGVNAELVPEFAKDLVWEGRAETLSNQVYVTARQYHMIKKLDEKADVVITDSPVLLGIVYAEDMPKCYDETLFWCHQQSSTPGLNFFVQRSESFETQGRRHDHDTSKLLDCKIADVLRHYEVNPTYVDKLCAVDMIVTAVNDMHKGRLLSSSV